MWFSDERPKTFVSPEMMKKVEGVFGQWRDSEVEDFRMRGIVVLAQAQDSDLLTHLEFDGSCG